MAQRRMFALTIVDSDAFIDMPLSSQALYFHLSMRADDDGFVNNPKKTQRMIGASDDDFKILIAKRFLMAFESGVIVIKHWNIHNTIQKDRYHPTVYKEEMELLKLKGNKAYTFCIQDGNNLETQSSLGKVSLGKVSIGKNSLNDDQLNKGLINRLKSQLSETELEALYDTYSQADKLIDYVQQKVDARMFPEPITHPYLYICQTADAMDWQRK